MTGPRGRRHAGEPTARSFGARLTSTAAARPGGPRGILCLLLFTACASPAPPSGPAVAPSASTCARLAPPPITSTSGAVEVPSEASSTETLRALAAALPGLPQRPGIPASGAFAISIAPLARAWPVGDAEGCGVIMDALALSARPAGPAVAVGGADPAGRARPAALLDHPATGPFAVWLDPPAGPPRGTVLIRPGHSDSFADHDARIGDALRAAGWMQVHLQGRLYQGSGEDEATRAWLRAGSSLLAVRTVETLVAAAWARTQPWADGNPLGVLGHSGGGVATCLLPRVVDGLDFVVADFCADLALPESTARIGDGFHPDLLPYRELLNEVGALGTPTLLTPYNFAGSADEVVAWLSERRRR